MFPEKHYTMRPCVWGVNEGYKKSYRSRYKRYNGSSYHKQGVSQPALKEGRSDEPHGSSLLPSSISFRLRLDRLTRMAERYVDYLLARSNGNLTLNEFSPIRA